MLISYDSEVDALHIELGTSRPVTSREIATGMSVDLDANGNLIGLEILEASERLGKEALGALVVEGLTTIVRSGEQESLKSEAIASAVMALPHDPPSAPTGKG